MRVASLSFFLYSLSLVAVTAGQGNLVRNIGDIVMSSSSPGTTTESSSSSETESASSTTSESTSTTEESTPTPTPTSSDSSTSTSESSSTDVSTTPTSTSDATTTTDASTTGPTSSDSSSSTTENAVTTIVTISGTPVPTTSTSANSSPDSTSAPGLNESSNQDESGLSSSNKKVVIGVVVGVGGAIVLGVIGIVIWRIRSKKNSGNDTDEAADLMSGTPIGAGAREKAPSPGAHGAGANNGTPFRSTLDQYHNPGPVNAAANF